MKLKNKSGCYLKKKVVVRGTDGEKYAAFSEEAILLEATIYAKSGRIADAQSGITQQYEKRILVDEPFTVTNEDGLETFWIRDGGVSMVAGDGICIYSRPDQNPDYRIVAIYPVGHLKILLERL